MSTLSPLTILFRNRLVLFFAVVFVIAYLYEGQRSKVFDLGIPLTTKNTVGEFYKVTKVTDGDTLHVMIGSEDETIRLLGINTPETVDPRRPVECFGKEASNHMKELAEGKIVRLEYDTTQNYRDTYNRILAYVYLEDGQMINKKMIADGYAYEYTYLTPYKYQKEFRELQRLARTSLRGIWAEGVCPTR